MSNIYDSCDNESDYNNHFTSLHMGIVCGQSNNNSIKEKTFQCEYCSGFFTFRQTLSRHRLYTCKARKNLNSENENLKQTVAEMQKAINENVIETKKLKEQINSAGNTYNISIKNFIQQNYADAPALTCLPDYNSLKYVDECEDDEDEDVNGDNKESNKIIDDDDLAFTLAQHYEEKHLHIFLGDFLIQNYKKDDPKTQSLWTSDTTRLTYIIKELLANQKSVWLPDPKGTKTKICIVDPLLKYIRIYINEFWISREDKLRTAKIDIVRKYNETFTILYKIKKDIDNSVLGPAIIKYIAPHFYMDKSRNISIA